MHLSLEVAMATPCTCLIKRRLGQWGDPCRSPRCRQGRLNVEEAAYRRALHAGACTCGFRRSYVSFLVSSRQHLSAEDCTSSQCELRGVDRGTELRLRAERTRGVYRGHLHWVSVDDVPQDSVPVELSVEVPLAGALVLQSTGWI
jgi:hypothetical protein